MPTYIYKAITPQGQVVRNRMNDASKISCIKKLKRNGLIPISVTQTFTTHSRASKSLKKKNVTCMFFFDTRNWTNPKGMNHTVMGTLKN